MIDAPTRLGLGFWILGLVSASLFLSCLYFAQHQGKQGPAFGFLVYWLGHLLFSFAGFAVYQWITAKTGQPFARHADVTSLLLAVFSIGFFCAWWTNQILFRGCAEKTKRESGT